jgi:hypothetical protein
MDEQKEMKKDKNIKMNIYKKERRENAEHA